MYLLYKREKNKTYWKLKRKRERKKLKSYTQIMLIFENIQTRNYLHTQIKYNIYIYIHTHNNTTRTCLHYHSLHNNDTLISKLYTMGGHFAYC